MIDGQAAIDWLLASGEPAIRYRARTWLRDRPETDPEVRRDRELAPDGPIVSTLLDFPGPGVNPFRTWCGVLGRLV
jgi:hypothetical protein